jgi:nucleotide-binding universal stress UspA family protein
MSGIIVGIDGSVHSRRALEWAIREAATRRAPLTVLTVQQDRTGFWGQADHPHRPDPGLVGQAAKEAQAETDDALDSLAVRSRLPSVTVRAVAGVPAEEILNAAHEAEMIVVGARGAGGFKKLLMGSVSVQITHHARCPVVVIPVGTT